MLESAHITRRLISRGGIILSHLANHDNEKSRTTNLARQPVLFGHTALLEYNEAGGEAFAQLDEFA
jgi:hypothetical protein